MPCRWAVAGANSIRFDRDVRYDVLKRTDMFRLGAEICDRWRKLTLDNRGPVLVDVFIKLAFFLRHSGQLKKALRATQLIELRSPVVKLSMGEKSVLATIRSSILLDLFETNRDLEDLKQARSYAGLAWANGQSDETNMVYQRLKKYENLVKDEQAIIERENSMRRLTNPEDDDAFKPYLEADKEKNENMSEEKSEHPSSDETNN